jgi:hypothetical protein
VVLAMLDDLPPALACQVVRLFHLREWSPGLIEAMSPGEADRALAVITAMRHLLGKVQDGGTNFKAEQDARRRRK